ncbi:MAG: RNA polymerase sigma factor [Actinomycetota bacterium]
MQVSMVLGGLGTMSSDRAERPVEGRRERQTLRDAGFGDVFETYRRPALRLAYVLTGDAAEAEDVVAEAFARMYPHFTSGKIEDPGAYLRRTVVNVVRGRFRRLATRRNYEAGRRRGEPSIGSDDVGVVERDSLRLALLSLPPRQRAAVVLRVLEDLSEADTAAMLGVSVGTVKGYVSRGLERLRAVLGDAAEGIESELR